MRRSNGAGLVSENNVVKAHRPFVANRSHEFDGLFRNFPLSTWKGKAVFPNENFDGEVGDNQGVGIEPKLGIARTDAFGISVQGLHAVVKPIGNQCHRW